MTEETIAENPARKPLPVWVDRLTPRAGVRVQLFSAALVWLIGAGVLLVRGVIFLSQSHWAVWIVALALAIGLVKGHVILYRYAEKGTAHVRARGKACYFGFLSVRSWIFVIVMMGGGIELRRLATTFPQVGWIVPALAVLYIAVGIGLLYADRVYWAAALGKPEPKLD